MFPIRIFYPAQDESQSFKTPLYYMNEELSCWIIKSILGTKKTNKNRQKYKYRKSKKEEQMTL